MGERARIEGLVVPAVVAMVALAVGAASLGLAPPISGRLHPAIVPAALAALALLSALHALRAKGEAEGEGEGPHLRPVLALSVSVLILAFGTRTIGVMATAFLCAAACSLGVRGVSLARALLVGLFLAGALSLALALLRRQPLPVLPPGLSW